MVKRTSQVIVVGSVNADYMVRVPRLPARGETVTGGTLFKREGGKGANQAIAAARFGADVRFIGAVGADATGAAAIRALADEGIDTDGVDILPGIATGFAAVLVDEQGENQIAVAPGANHQVSVEHVHRALADSQVGAGDVMLLSFEIPDPPIIAAARFAREHGVQVIVNPAPSRPLPQELVSLSPILTPNAREVIALDDRAPERPQAPQAAAPQDHEPCDAARSLSRLTGAAVVVTLGAEGALAVVDGLTMRQQALSVTPEDTTGAGDAFSGVLAAGLACGESFAETLRLATAAASLSVTGTGARTALPTRHQVMEALESMPAAR